jgi:DNA-directed RNA polymerase specialized sigma24 family protein
VKGHDITAEPNSGLSTPHLDATVSVWAERILLELRRLYVNKLQGVFAADDAAQNFLVRFCESPETWMAKCPTPEGLARYVSSNELLDGLRDERVQTCEGARLVTRPDGSKVSGRKNVPFDNVDSRRLAARDNIEFEAVESATTTAQVQQVLRALQQDDAWLLSQLWIQGRPTREVNAELGCSSTAFRQRVKRARERFRNEYDQLFA